MSSSSSSSSRFQFAWFACRGKGRRRYGRTPLHSVRTSLSKSNPLPQFLFQSLRRDQGRNESTRGQSGKGRPRRRRDLDGGRRQSQIHLDGVEPGPMANGGAAHAPLLSIVAIHLPPPYIPLPLRPPNSIPSNRASHS
jgi:hypothetical protein